MITPVTGSPPPPSAARTSRGEIGTAPTMTARTRLTGSAPMRMAKTAVARPGVNGVSRVTRSPGQRNSSGCTSFAYSRAANPTRGPGRLKRLPGTGYTRLFFTAFIADQPGRAATSSTVVP